MKGKREIGVCNVPVWYYDMMYSVYKAGVPGGLVCYPRDYKNQLREFNSHRVHILVGSLSCIKKILAESARA